MSRQFYARYGKRVLDIFLCCLVLLPLLPLIGVLALLVRWKLGRPVYFRQQRAGRDSVPFTLIKFRTMTLAEDRFGRPLPDADRLTPFGAWLRRSSLDELPELWNVFRGHMTFVGPRPLLLEYLEMYSPKEARRHSIRPGLTGLAQVQGRNSISWEQRFQLDLWYVDNVSLRLDIWILARTIGRVMSGEGASAEGSATMPPLSREIGDS